PVPHRKANSALLAAAPRKWVISEACLLDGQKTGLYPKCIELRLHLACIDWIHKNNDIWPDGLKRGRRDDLMSRPWHEFALLMRIHVDDSGDLLVEFERGEERNAFGSAAPKDNALALRDCLRNTRLPGCFRIVHKVWERRSQRAHHRQVEFG